jgi:hypothetical protein
VATTLAYLEARVREHLNEPVPRFWSSREIVDHLLDGMKNLWRVYYDTYQDYFVTIDSTNVSLAADAYVLTGVPADVSIVRGIEPRALTTYPNLQFSPRDYLSPEFTAARGQSAQDPGYTDVIYYTIHGAGGPVSAPTIRTAPKLSSALNVSLIYVPVLPALVVGDTNPVPGESDDAIIAWATAHALAKSKEDQMPDAGWVQKYTAGKEQLRTGVTPRQTHEPEVVPAFFEVLW